MEGRILFVSFVMDKSPWEGIYKSNSTEEETEALIMT